MKNRVSLVVIGVILAATLVACQFSSMVPTGLLTTATPPPVSSVPSAPAAPAAPVSSVPATNLVNQQDKFVAIYQQVSPSVVTILTSTGLGSGWVYDAQGDIVTNNHVVQGETKVEVDFTSGQKVYGNVIGTDAYSDLAVVKVDPTAGQLQLHPVALGDSSSIQIGQIVIAIGNPFGLSGSMTTGVISGLGRTIQSGPQTTSGGTFSSGDIIQTDAPINPGNSGGPLLSLNGEVIGVNSQIETNNTNASGQPTSSGVGFAISVNTLKRVIPSLISKGKYDYPYLGITSFSGSLSLDVVQVLGLKATSGVYVTSVAAGGPASKAGIRAGTTPVTVQGYSGLSSGSDLIVAADGQPIVDYDSLITYLALHKSPGDTVTLTVLRGDQKVDVPVVLGARP